MNSAVSYGASQRSSLRNFPSHFLEACFLCKKPLGHNSDIFMYRGDTPFCSEECRQEQIKMDEAKEIKFTLTASIKALRKNDQRKATENYTFHIDTAAAA